MFSEINEETPAVKQVFYKAGRAGFEPANEVLAPLTA